MSQPATSKPASSTTSNTTAHSLTPELDKLTTAVLEVSDNIQACSQASDARHAACLARADEQNTRTASMQDRIAQMLAMTQEGLRREKEEPLKVPDSHKFKRDLQRAAFGMGGDSESASRSSMLESRNSIVRSAEGSRESQPEPALQPGEYRTGSPGSIRASRGSDSQSQSGILSDTNSWQEV